MKILLLIALFATSIIAQKNVIAVTVVYNREAVNLETVQGEKFAWDAARDSVGGQFTWDYHPADNAFFVGAQAGATFHNKQLEDVTVNCGPGCTATSAGKISKVAKGFFDYRMGVAKRSGTFQPGVAALVGIKNGNFGGISAGPGGTFSVRRGSSFTYGGVGWIDLCFDAKKGTCWRSGLQLQRAFSKDATGWDATVQTGLAFKF